MEAIVEAGSSNRWKREARGVASSTGEGEGEPGVCRSCRARAGEGVPLVGREGLSFGDLHLKKFLEEEMTVPQQRRRKERHEAWSCCAFVMEEVAYLSGLIARAALTCLPI
jgi:hypothetical protein